MPRRADSVLRARYCAFGLSLVLWLVSLALPSLGARGGPALTGYEILMQGISAWRYGVVAWFANPALFLAVAAGLTGRNRTSLAMASLGLLLGASSIWSDEIARLAGRSVPELFLLPGFYCWMAAHTVAVIGGMAGVVKSAREV